MAIVYGKRFGWLTETFMVEKDKAYNTDDPYVAEALRRFPDAFGGQPEVSGVEQATAAPGERRNVRRGE